MASLLTPRALLCRSFVTHLFIVNEIEDPAVERQVIARAHRMGATGPVTVQTLRLWEGEEKKKQKEEEEKKEQGQAGAAQRAA